MALKTSGFSKELHPIFKPKEHLSSYAVAIEPLSVTERENKKFGGTNNWVDCKIAVFQTADQLQKGEPASHQMWVIAGGAMADSLADDAGTGDISFGKIVAVPSSKGNDAIVLRDFSDPAVIEAAVAWHDKVTAEADDEFASMIG